MKKIILFWLSFIVLAATFVFVSCKSSNSSKETYSLQTTVSPSESGSVTPASGSFDENEQVQLSATANSGWVFKEWNGDLSGSNNPATVTINKNMSINALFEQLTYPLTVEVDGEGHVSEQIVNAKTDYTEGTVVELTAEPETNWEFSGWSGDLSGSENPATITMNQAKTVTAQFEEKTYPLTINIQGEGTVNEDIVNGKTTNYSPGSMVELTAEPSEDWWFDKWIGDLESNENPATITMNGPKTINAVFDFGFREDFEDGVAQNWLFSDNQYAIENGMLKYSLKNKSQGTSAYYDRKFKDFKLQAKVSHSAGITESGAVIFIRSDGLLIVDEDSKTFTLGYFFMINPEVGVAVVKSENVGNETESSFLYEEELNLKGGLDQFHDITINANGSTFDLFMNGEHIYSFTDDKYSEGYITIASVCFENGKNCNTNWEHVNVFPADPPRNN